MLSYDEGNKTLLFLTVFFANASELARKATFFVVPGQLVTSGMQVGVVIFNDGSREPMIVPRGAANTVVSGTVVSINRQIKYETLDRSPAQFAIELV